jgi:putative phosphoribosyl transferase
MGAIIDDPRLRERVGVFADRHDAGNQLAIFLRTHLKIRDPMVMAIPAGGVPIGAAIARLFRVPLELAIVRKIRIPGTTESGFGAVTWDGRVLFNDRLLAALGLAEEEIERAVEETRTNVKERIRRFSGSRAFPDLAGKSVVLTDDGLASGFTMLAAVEGVRAHQPARVIVAVPTASAASAALAAREADELVCLNIRSGRRFAVAEAYERWYDLDDGEVLLELKRAREP